MKISLICLPDSLLWLLWRWDFAKIGKMSYCGIFPNDDMGFLNT